jgi:exodeoxyribonuclease V gamma subunit
VLLQAWEEGMRRPLPFDVQGATAYLKALEPRKGRPPEPDAPAKAREAVQACYEQQRDRDICLARAYQDFDALWCGGEFARWTEALLQPLRHHLGPPPKDDSDQGAE